MSEENVELVRRAFDAFAEGGAEATMAFFSPEVVLYPFPEWVAASEYRGHDGVRTLLAEWTDNFDDFEFEVHKIRGVGNKVLVLGETIGRIKGSNVPIRQPLGAVYSEFRDNRIVDGHHFLTWRQAREAVGLSE